MDRSSRAWVAALKTASCTFFLAAASGLCFAGQDTEKIATYFDVAADIHAYLESYADEQERKSPESSQEIRTYALYMDDEEYIKYIAQVFDKLMTKEEVDSLVAFIDSPSGKPAQKVLAASANEPDYEKLKKSLPAEQVNAFLEFYRHPAAMKAMKVMDSDLWADTAGRYSSFLLCRHFEQKFAKLLPREEIPNCELGPVK